MELERSTQQWVGFVSVSAAVLLGAGSALLGVCGPFLDVSDATFCPFVLEIFYLGITTGTTPTTYDPTSPVTRLQMAAFLSRSVDGVLKRGSRRAALEQFWNTQGPSAMMSLTTLGAGASLARSDGFDVWVSGTVAAVGVVFRVSAGDGKLLETWTGATNAFAVLSAMGRIFVTGNTAPGRLYRIDPRLTAGTVTTLATNLGSGPVQLSFDGSRIWSANVTSPGSVSIVTPGPTTPWTVTTVTAGLSVVRGVTFDGSNIWAANSAVGTIVKLDASGAILQTVTIGSEPSFLTFDGTNIWVPNEAGGSISIVRPGNGAVLATLTGNGMNAPVTAAFDGQRMLVTNLNNNSVSLWKAADLSPLGNFPTGVGFDPYGACSDGINFWVVFQNGTLARF